LQATPELAGEIRRPSFLRLGGLSLSPRILQCRGAKVNAVACGACTKWSFRGLTGGTGIRLSRPESAR